MLSSPYISYIIDHVKSSRITKILILALIAVLVLVASKSASAQYQEVTRLGTSQAICPKPGVQSLGDLQAFFSRNRSIVDAILDDADWQGDRQMLFEAVAAGEVSDVQIPSGATFDWMGMREQGVPKALPKRIWAGDDAVDAFGVSVTGACRVDQFVIPKICCNLALAKTETIIDTPRLELVASGQTLTICSQPNAAVTLQTPTQTEQLTLDDSSCWVGDGLPSGLYRATALTDCGQSQKAIELLPPEAKKPSLVPFIAPFIGSETVMRLETAWQMDMRDTSGLGGVRAGLKIPINKTLSWVPTLGVMHRNGVNGGNEYPDDSASLDLGIEKTIAQKYFIGAGVGLWNVDDSDFREPSLFITTGGAITGSLDWFAELRGIDSDNDDGNDGVDDNHFYGGGLRFKF